MKTKSKMSIRHLHDDIHYRDGNDDDDSIVLMRIRMVLTLPCMYEELGHSVCCMHTWWMIMMSGAYCTLCTACCMLNPTCRRLPVARCVPMTNGTSFHGTTVPPYHRVMVRWNDAPMGRLSDEAIARWMQLQRCTAVRGHCNSPGLHGLKRPPLTWL